MSGETLFKTICIRLSIFYKVEGGGCACSQLCLSQGSGRKMNSAFKVQGLLFIQGQIQFDHRDQKEGQDLPAFTRFHIIHLSTTV